MHRQDPPWLLRQTQRDLQSLLWRVDEDSHEVTRVLLQLLRHHVLGFEAVFIYLSKWCWPSVPASILAVMTFAISWYCRSSLLPVPEVLLAGDLRRADPALACLLDALGDL